MVRDMVVLLVSSFDIGWSPAARKRFTPFARGLGWRPPALPNGARKATLAAAPETE
jgi:hypothetical protein